MDAAVEERPSEPRADSAILEIGEAHFRSVARASDRFFREKAEAVAAACRDMAGRFHAGGRLFAFGSGAAASDAYHVAVEFVHPVIVGKRALPAVCLEAEPARELRLLGRPQDIALGIASDGGERRVVEGLRTSADGGLLTVGLAGGAEGAIATLPLDHRFIVPEKDPAAVQEVQETLYHVLWELVHVFFDHEELL